MRVVPIFRSLCFMAHKPLRSLSARHSYSFATNNFTKRPQMTFLQQYSAERKLQIIEYAKLHSNKEAAKHHSIHLSMIYRWRVAEPKLRAAKTKQIKIGSGRRPFYPEEERQVIENAKGEIIRGCCVSFASMAVDMRGTVSAMHPDSQFKASSGWIKGMKKRTGCRLKVATNPNVMPESE